jgi:hypothetical protein
VHAFLLDHLSGHRCSATTAAPLPCRWMCCSIGSFSCVDMITTADRAATELCRHLTGRRGLHRGFDE